jgi:hypothetical protein
LSNNFLHTPTKEQLDELTIHCETHPIKNYNGVIGLYGTMFVSKINGNHIFIPFAGDYTDSKLCNQKSLGGIWSSTIKPTLTLGQQHVLQDRNYLFAYYMCID